MKFYLSKDNELNLFSIIQSSSGFIIPLCNFDFNNHHLTICFKDVGFKKGIDIHITNDIIKKQIYNKYYEINLEKIEQYCVEKFIIFYKNEMKKYLHRKLEDKNNFYCLDCYFNKHFEGINFSKKNSVRNTFNSISKIEKEEILLNIHKFPLCDKPKYRTIYNPNTNEQYLLFFEEYIITLEEQDDLIKRILFFIENEFIEFIDSINQIFKEIKEIIQLPNNDS